MSITKEELRRLRELTDKSTRVVGWYAHSYSGEVRGPYHRWFKCTGNEDKKYPTAEIEDDVKYAAAAMTSLPALLDHIDKLNNKILNLEIDNEILTDD